MDPITRDMRSDGFRLQRPMGSHYDAPICNRDLDAIVAYL
jgi:hypothetical protein